MTDEWSVLTNAGMYHDEHYWYAMIELGVPYTFMKRDFDRVLDAFEVSGKWYIRCGFEWEEIGDFSKEWA
tara:strand:+ start:39 stop:248 length:210 start_codon:yes stop_codon:yes gene_type:complete